jgi:hypothetical protein
VKPIFQPAYGQILKADYLPFYQMGNKASMLLLRDAYHFFPKGGCGGGAHKVRLVFVKKNGSREWRWTTRLG